MAQHNTLGKLGELCAAEYLKRQGCIILEQNFRAGHWEIDIIASEGKFLTFVEVKTRSSEILHTAISAVSQAKCRALVYAAEEYMKKHNLAPPVRFDVITVVGHTPDDFVIKHYRNAFNPYSILHKDMQRRNRGDLF